MPAEPAPTQVLLCVLPFAALQQDTYAACLSPARTAALSALPAHSDAYWQSLGVELALCAALRHRDATCPLPPRYARTPTRQPYLCEANAGYISLSHTQGCAVCALASAPVGVDVERCRTLRAPLQALCSPQELAMERAADLSLFVGKESFLKLLGVGFRVNPREYTLQGNTVCGPLGSGVLHYPTLPGYCCCVATHTRAQITTLVLQAQTLHALLETPHTTKTPRT